MKLQEFKEHIESFPKGTEFKFSISEPFSWRGSYDEVAFSIKEEPSSRDEILDKIEKAFSDTFYGYKGGEYRFHEFTPVNFEEDCRSYTDGGYVGELISKIQNIESVSSEEERFVKLAFRE